MTRFSSVQRLLFVCDRSLGQCRGKLVGLVHFGFSACWLGLSLLLLRAFLVFFLFFLTFLALRVPVNQRKVQKEDSW